MISVRDYCLARKQLFRWTAWFFGANALLFWLIGARYLLQIIPLQLTVSNTLTESLAWSFLLCAFIGHLALLAFLPGILFVAGWLLFFPNRTVIFVTAILWATVAATLLVVDTQVFALFRFHLNSAVLALLTSGKANQIFNFSWSEWLLVSVLIIVLLLLEIVLGWWLWCKQCRQESLRYGKYWLGLGAACLLLSYVMFLEAGVYSSLSFAQQTFALPLYDDVLSRLLPIKNSLHKMEMLGNGNYAQLNYPNKLINYPLHPLIIHPPKKPLNIVIIVIDTWRFDEVSAQVTPHIDQFAQQAWQFTNHFSGGNGTEPGIFSLLYGLPASYWTAMTEQHRGPVLFDALLKQQYQIGIFASAPLSAPAFNKNVFVAVKDLPIVTPGDTVYARDQFITREFQQFVAQAGKKQTPFFSFIFYDAAHSYCENGNPVSLFKPQINVCNHLVLNNYSDPTPYRHRYQNALYFVDDLVGIILKELKQRGLLANTVVLLTGDHGNEFNDNHLGYWEHASNFTRYQTQTPLIVYWPGQSPRVFNHLTSHYDIVPSLLTMALGCENLPSDYSIGRSLLDNMTPGYLLVSSYINFGIRENNQITTFFPTGDYVIEDLTGRTVSKAKLNPIILQQVFADMTRYYRP